MQARKGNVSVDLASPQSIDVPLCEWSQPGSDRTVRAHSLLLATQESANMSIVMDGQGACLAVHQGPQGDPGAQVIKDWSTTRASAGWVDN